MEKNIFENAYFGKAYKTKDGRKALYQRNFLSKYIEPSDGREYYISLHTVMTEQYIWQVDDEGKREDLRRMSSNLDIVSEWNEEVDEEKYEEKFNSLYESCRYWEAYEDEPALFAEAFKELLNFAINDKRTIDFCADMIKSRKTIFNEVNKAITTLINPNSKENNEE